MKTNVMTKKVEPGGGKTITHSPLKDTLKSGSTSTKRDGKGK